MQHHVREWLRNRPPALERNVYVTVHPRHAAADSSVTGGQCLRTAPPQLHGRDPASFTLLMTNSLRGRARGGAAAPRSRPAPPRGAPAARPQTPAAPPAAPARPPRPPRPAPPRSAPRGLAARAPATISVGIESGLLVCCLTAHEHTQLPSASSAPPRSAPRSLAARAQNGLGRHQVMSACVLPCRSAE